MSAADVSNVRAAHDLSVARRPAHAGSKRKGRITQWRRRILAREGRNARRFAAVAAAAVALSGASLAALPAAQAAARTGARDGGPGPLADKRDPGAVIVQDRGDLRSHPLTATGHWTCSGQFGDHH
jgi:hypothetical protein